MYAIRNNKDLNKYFLTFKGDAMAHLHSPLFPVSDVQPCLTA